MEKIPGKIFGVEKFLPGKVFKGKKLVPVSEITGTCAGLHSARVDGGHELIWGWGGICISWKERLVCYGAVGGVNNKGGWHCWPAGLLCGRALAST